MYFLVKQYRDRSISNQELQELKQYLQRESADDALDAVFVEMAEKDGLLAPDMDEALFDKINASIEVKSRLKNEGKVRRLLYAKIAAAVLVVLGVSLLVWKVKGPAGALPVEEALAVFADPIVPGNNKARVLLDDGREIDLESLPNDTVLQMEGYALVKSKEGEIFYRMAVGEKPRDGGFNTIIVPKGGEYKLNLPDGSEVWMNASSSLKYPLDFGSESREVELQGEAYFSVRKKKVGTKNLPFIVHAGKQKLEVLGTAFNVNTYTKAIKTTLVEGAVQLSFPNGKTEKLKPNEQAVFNDQTEKLTIKTVQPYFTTAWKDGVFAFDKATLAEVMDCIARWYDVSFDYEVDHRTIRFTGVISRYEKIEKLLQAIEMTNSVKFKIRERRIMVQPL